MSTSSSPGPTARELLTVLQPQLDGLQESIGEIRKDTTYLRECVAAQKTEQAANERRITRLEGKVLNGTAKLPEPPKSELLPVLQSVASWLFRFMLGGAAIALGVNIGKVVEYLIPK